MVTSKLTARAQTTLPPAVRTVLRLEAGERIGYVIEGDEVRIVNASASEHGDPVLDRFLAFLGRDLAKHPSRISPFPASLLERARALATGVKIDHAAPMDGAITL